MASNLEYLDKVWEGDKAGKGQIEKPGCSSMEFVLVAGSTKGGS